MKSTAIRRTAPRQNSSVSTEIEANRNLITAYSWAWYGFSLMVPFAGIFVALFLYDQDSREVRKVGRACLLISFVVWVVFPLLVLMSILILSTFALMSWISDMIPSAD